jgi:hypothetical protein
MQIRRVQTTCTLSQTNRQVEEFRIEKIEARRCGGAEFSVPGVYRILGVEIVVDVQRIVL